MAETLTWRFGELVIVVEVERQGGTWKLTAPGKRETLVVVSNSFPTAAANLRDKIEDRLREHRARQAGLSWSGSPPAAGRFRP